MFNIIRILEETKKLDKKSESDTGNSEVSLKRWNSKMVFGSAPKGCSLREEVRFEEIKKKMRRNIKSSGKIQKN